MFGEHVRIALASLKATRTRTALTTLGIVIGISAICIVWALGEGAKKALSDSIGRAGKDVITIRPGKIESNASKGLNIPDAAATGSATTLSEYDLQTIKDTPGVTAAAPIMRIPGSIKTELHEASGASIIATNPSLDVTQQLTPHVGQFIDNTTNRETVALGYQLSLELFGTDDALGRLIKIRGQSFTVIGVLKETKQPPSVGGFDYNRAAFISLDAGKSFTQGLPQIQQIVAKAENESKAAGISAEIRKKLLLNHGGEEDFAVLRSQQASAISDNAFRVVISVTSAIASVSLIVGGIGIMNIMLVSVSERTREVGIRKAVGASNNQIMSQFLIEAIILSLSGYFIGIIFSTFVVVIAGLALSFNPILTWQIVFVSFCVALGVGVLFGLFPALKAARKDPIEALRQLE